MSNLPHPLGDTNPGDLFYPGSPDVVVSDTPGVAGSRAVEFGEDGLSSVVNRMGYALGKNDEYMEARLEQEFARPDLVTFTPAGGNGGNYTFAADVWCGDTYYTPESQDMRNALITVLDDKYNELIDPSSGDAIVVKQILDAPAGSSQVGAGFITNPYITFRKQHPVTGALGADYTIPDGQKVWLAFGRSATLEDLVGATQGHLQDAWFRGFTRSIKNIDAASFLRDGSRVATGDFDMGNNGLLAVGGIWGPQPTGELVIATSGATGHLSLLSNDAQVRFKDDWLPSYLPLNDGDSSLLGYYTSMLTSLNSKTGVAQSFFGNRSLNRNGSFTFTDGTGQISWPALYVCINGERRVIAAGNILASSGANAILVVDSTGTVVERDYYELQSDDIPLTAHQWTGASFTKKIDIRWAYHSTSRHLEITCGDTNGFTCDFGPTELDKAVALACTLASSSWLSSGMPRIRIFGKDVRAPSTAPYNIKLTAGIQIVGNGPDNSWIRSDEVAGDAVDFINCDGWKIVVRDLTVCNSSDYQTSTVAAFLNAGSDSIFENLVIRADSWTYERGFANVFKWTQQASRVLIRNIYADSLGYTSNSFIYGSTSDYSTPYLKDSHIQDCWLGWDPSPASPIPVGILANGDGNIIENVSFNYGLADRCIVAGNNTLVTGCRFNMQSAAGADPTAIWYHPLSSSTYGTALKVTNCFFKNVPGNGFKISAINDTLMVVRIVVHGCEFFSVDKPFVMNNQVAIHASSSVEVTDCTTYDTNQFIAYVDNLWHFKFHNNVCTTVGGDGIATGLNGGATITHNFIEGYGSAGTYQNAIEIGIGGPTCMIHGNIIGSTGVPINTHQVRLWRRVNFTNNGLIGYGPGQGVGVGLYWFFFGADESNVSGNQFHYHGKAIVVGGGANRCIISNNCITDAYMYGVRIEDAVETQVRGNNFWGSGSATFSGIGVSVYGSAAFMAECTQIVGNHFRGVTGTMPDPVVGVIHIQANTASACPDCMIEGNFIYDCGTTGTPTGLHYPYIWSSGIRVQIIGNHVRVLKGGPTITTVGIQVQTEPTTNRMYAIVMGNTIRHNMSDGQGSQTMIGIQLTGASYYSEAILALNVVSFAGGSASGAGKVTKGFYLWNNNDLIVVGNLVSDWTHTGATNYGFDDGGYAGTRNTYVANFGHMNNNIHANSKPSTAAYNVNANNPRSDFNFGTGF